MIAYAIYRLSVLSDGKSSPCIFIFCYVLSCLPHLDTWKSIVTSIEVIARWKRDFLVIYYISHKLKKTMFSLITHYIYSCRLNSLLPCFMLLHLKRFKKILHYSTLTVCLQKGKHMDKNGKHFNNQFHDIRTITQTKL